MGYYSNYDVESKDREELNVDDLSCEMIKIIIAAFPGRKEYNLIELSEKRLRTMYNKAKLKLEMQMLDQKFIDKYYQLDQEYKDNEWTL